MSIDVGTLSRVRRTEIDRMRSFYVADPGPHHTPPRRAGEGHRRAKLLPAGEGPGDFLLGGDEGAAI